MKNQIMNTLRQMTQPVRYSLLLVAALLFVANPAAAQTATAPFNMGPTLNKIAGAGVLYAAHREAATPVFLCRQRRGGCPGPWLFLGALPARGEGRE